MRNCQKCNKELAKTTKGDLCQQCYRNRNNSPHNHKTTVDDSNESLAIIDEPHGNQLSNDILEDKDIFIVENNKKLAPLFKTNDKEDKDDRTIIDILKNNMMQERQGSNEIINILKEQVTFMKEEISHKNELIKQLMSELTAATNDVISRSINENTSKNKSRSTNSNCSINSSSKKSNIMIDNYDIVPTTDFLNWHDPEWNENNKMTYASNYENKRCIKRTLITDDDSDTDNEAVIINHQSTSFAEAQSRKATSVANTQRNDNFTKVQKRRPAFVTNKFPERDRKPYRTTKHVPGNSAYAAITQRGKKVAIISDSICGGMNMAKLNRELKNKHAYKRLFPGVTPDDLQYYCLRTLEKDKPDIAIINVGTNNIGKEDPFNIASEIIKVVKLCQERGCNKVYVSSIIHRPDYPDMVVQLNNILHQWQFHHDYELIYNDNINSTCICNDKIHLNYKGKDILSTNFRNILNKHQI